MNVTLAMLGAVLGASLLGSLHCAGMCGAFLAYALEPNSASRQTHFSLQFMYHLGRLWTYLLLGVIAGCAGSLVEMGGIAIGVQHLASSVVGAMMVLFGIRLLLVAAGKKTLRFPVPKCVATFVGTITRRVSSWPAVPRAFLIGTTTTLLPCGWLYLFVATAATTRHPLSAMPVMLAFWIGTLPVLAAVGVGVRASLGPLRKHMPVATSMLVVLVGVLTLFGRLKPLNLESFQRAIDARQTGTQRAGFVPAASVNDLPCGTDTVSP